MRLSRLVRASCAALAVATYALPPATGALADLSHGAYHAYELVVERQARAAAFGLVHLYETPSVQGARAVPRGVSTPLAAPVHEHGGVRHSHAAPVDILRAAADDLDQEREHTAPTLIELASHIPARATPTGLPEPPSDGTGRDVGTIPSDRSLQPLLPPPRG
jgi:hypothetical protein